MHKDVDGRGKPIHMATNGMAGLDNELSKSHVDRLLKHFRVPPGICTANRRQATNSLRHEWMRASLGDEPVKYFVKHVPVARPTLIESSPVQLKRR